jgi:arsenite methyltransferase
MTRYLDTMYDYDTPAFAECYDQMPLWSSHFGHLLLDAFPYAPDLRVLDVGSGTGFPMLELAMRLGETSQVLGIDMWRAAMARAQAKVRAAEVENACMTIGDAAHLPFSDDVFDHVVSNIGLNNFDDPDTALSECCRVIRPGGSILLTSNFEGHMATFYDIFGQTLVELKMDDLLPGLNEHIQHRSTIGALQERLQRAGFRVTRVRAESFTLLYATGTALLNHNEIKYAFLPAWKDLVPPDARKRFFSQLETNLNKHAALSEGLRLNIPMGLVVGEKAGE